MASKKDGEFTKSKFLKRRSQGTNPNSHRSDLKYKEIRRLLAKKQKQKADNIESTVQEL